MAFKVSVQPKAVDDLDEMSRFILEGGNPDRSRRWRDGALDEIARLADDPEAGAIVPETHRLPFAYRQVHYHAHRIVYRIDHAAQTVVVARVYHGARRALREGDL